jgi:hypothetical protein
MRTSAIHIQGVPDVRDRRVLEENRVANQDLPRFVFAFPWKNKSIGPGLCFVLLRQRHVSYVTVIHRPS